jgi:hypothetical protein
VKKHALYVVLAGTALVLPLLTQAGTGAPREKRETQMAEQAILASLVLHQSPAGAHLCSGNDIACLGPDKAELGLALIGARRSTVSDGALVSLLRFAMDGSLSEDHTCYVLSRGTAIQFRLAKVKPEKLRQECESDFSRLIAGNPDLKDFQSASVCRDAKAIQAKATEFLKEIRTGQKCGSEDF